MGTFLREFSFHFKRLVDNLPFIPDKLMLHFNNTHLEMKRE